jgi:hypothetical protein
LYAPQLRAWLRFFEPRQFLVRLSDAPPPGAHPRLPAPDAAVRAQLLETSQLYREPERVAEQCAAAS